MKNSLDKKVIFMTGATSGLGKVSALRAAANGATIIALARTAKKGNDLIKEYQSKCPSGSGNIEIVEGNLNSFDSISQACHKVLKLHPTIDMIVNNAGIMNFERKITIDNIEETLQVNLLSPLLICDLLINNLSKTDSTKIIWTSSGLHQGQINFDNLEFKNNFSSFKVYRQSKLGVILICRLLAQAKKLNGIGIYSQHPGMVRTELGRDAGWFSKMIFYLMGTSPEKGSKTLSFLIENPNSKLQSGEYYANKKVTTTTKEASNLDVARKLLKTANEYLIPYLGEKSGIC